MNKLKNIFNELFSFSLLSKDYFHFAMVHVGYLVFSSIANVFFNTLFYRVSGNSDIVMYYNIIYYGCIGLSMSLAAFFMRKTASKNITRAGLILIIVMYIIIFLVLDNMAAYMPLIAVLFGTGAGFYFIAYCINLTRFSQDDTRDVAMSIIGMISGVISLIVPAVSGVVISTFDKPDTDSNLTGYIIMFTVSLVAAVITLILASKIPENEILDKKYQLKKALKAAFTNSTWLCGLMSEFLKGVREGTFIFFLNILLFEYITNEALVGLNTFLTGATSILSFWVATKFLRPHNRIKYMFWGINILIIITAAMFFNLSPVTIIMLSLINAFTNSFIINTPTTTFFMLMDRMPHANDIKFEILSLRECFFASGRILGVLVILFVPRLFENIAIGYVTSILILTLTQYATLGLTSLTLKLAQIEISKQQQ